MKPDNKDEYKFITTVKEINAGMWDEFVLSHPNGNFFYTREFYNSLKDSTSYDAEFVASFEPGNKNVRCINRTDSTRKPGCL